MSDMKKCTAWPKAEKRGNPPDLKIKAAGHAAGQRQIWAALPMQGRGRQAARCRRIAAWRHGNPPGPAATPPPEERGGLTRRRKKGYEKKRAASAGNTRRSEPGQSPDGIIASARHDQVFAPEEWRVPQGFSVIYGLTSRQTRPPGCPQQFARRHPAGTAP